jgi:hypothetical protein
MKDISRIMVVAAALAALIAAAFIGCSFESRPGIADLSALDGSLAFNVGTTGSPVITVNPQTVTLYAGQTIEVGSVSLSIEGTDLHVTYTMAGGWELTETHLWIGESLAGMPQTKAGNPTIGNFPWKSGDITDATTYTFVVPIGSFTSAPCNTMFYAAAHASVRKDTGGGSYQTETAWAGSDPLVGQGSWATYFTFTLICDSWEEPEGGCETAFAYGGEKATTFTDLIGTPRWGWSNGPLIEGDYAFDIYAGAGRNDLDRGTLVGTLTVHYADGTATVTYALSEGFTLSETHLYAGTATMPVKKKDVPTFAPGQYGNNHDLDAATGDTFTVEGLSGDIYIVAHAVVCGDFIEQ